MSDGLAVEMQDIRLALDGFAAVGHGASPARPLSDTQSASGPMVRSRPDPQNECCQFNIWADRALHMGEPQ